MSELPKSNVLTEMTAELHHLFKVAGCDPTYHCCNNKIPAGEEFKLAEVTQGNIDAAKVLGGNRIFKTDEPHDVMLCSKIYCTPAEMVRNKKASVERYKRMGLSAYGQSYRTGGCSIVNGKIVP